MPRIEAVRHTCGYPSASFLSRHAVCKQFVVPRVDVPDVSSNGKIDTLVAMLGHAGVRVQVVVGRKSKVA